MISKQRLLKSIEKMPEAIDVDELLDKVLLIQKIEQGLAHSKEGKVTANGSFKKEMKQWFASTGRTKRKSA